MNRLTCSLVIALLSSTTSVVQAHFLWLVRHSQNDADRVELYFSEAAEPDDAELLRPFRKIAVHQIDPDGRVRPLTTQWADGALFAPLADQTSGAALFTAQHVYGVLDRGGDVFLLKYYAKTGPELSNSVWRRTGDDAAGNALPLDLVPQGDQGEIRVTVHWHGKPLSGAQVKVRGPGLEELELQTDQQGEVVFRPGKPGLYSVRARHIENQAGQHDGRQFTSIRHYSTLALRVSDPKTTTHQSSPHPEPGLAVLTPYPPLPQPVTSFGAAILDDTLYVYGGHTGEAHQYWDGSQANTLRRLDLKRGDAWEQLGSGPRLQGFAMVANRGKLYRLGGFHAKNPKGQEHDLWSQADVACYDPSTGQWTALPPLPEPRSSFDAAVLDDHLYVIGGWQLAGQADPVWHRTAYVLDLTSDAPQWRQLPQPPFRRRALAVAAHDGKIYAIGGMQDEGGPTTRVDVFDPSTGTWSQGPSLPGAPMDGFGPSACSTGDHLYVSTMSGQLLRLTTDPASWEMIGKLPRARFFHRMLPMSDNRLIIVGGANMEIGKFEELDVVQLQ